MCCVKSLWCLVSLVLLNSVQSHKICELDDKDCMTHIASRAYKYVVNGVKDLIEPMQVLHLSNVNGEITPNLKYTLSNVTLTNMKDCEVKGLIVKKSDLTYTYYLRCPKLILHFEFEGIGTVDKGTLNDDDHAEVQITIDDYLLTFKGLYGKINSEKELEPRLFIKRNNIETEIKGKATFESYNLIRGSNEGFEETKAFMNENPKEMAKFLQSPMMEELMKQFIDIINIYLKSNPLNEVLRKE